MMGKIEAIYPLNDRFEFFITLGAKTDGWVAGELSLEEELNFYLGTNIMLQ